MEKTAKINIRIKPEVKDEAEDILRKLGIAPSNAIDMFYRQIILNKGLPFDLKIPEEKSMDISKISKKELDELLKEGLKDIDDGNIYDVDEVFGWFRKMFKLKITGSAKEDINSIESYISLNLSSDNIARKTILDIKNAVKSLEVMPQRHRIYKSSSLGIAIRSFPVRNYLIFYSIDLDKEIVYILRVLYAKRNIDKILYQ